MRWNPDREFVGQGLANVAAGAFQGYPAGGSFSPSSLNRLSGARTRWSGVLTGVILLAFMSAATVLSDLPKTALAGLVIASVKLWRFFRPQGHRHREVFGPTSPWDIGFEDFGPFTSAGGSPRRRTLRCAP